MIKMVRDIPGTISKLIFSFVVFWKRDLRIYATEAMNEIKRNTCYKSKKHFVNPKHYDCNLDMYCLKSAIKG